MLLVAWDHKTTAFMLNFTTTPKVLFQPGRGHFMLPVSGDAQFTPLISFEHIYLNAFGFSVFHTPLPLLVAYIR